MSADPAVRDPSPESLADAFWSARPGPPTPGVAEALAELWDQARAAWPELRVEASGFMTFVAERLDAQSVLPDAITALRPGDLLLCHGCLLGDPIALGALDVGYLASTPSLVRRMRLSAAEADDVRQTLAQRLLVGTERSGPRLQAYSGRGDLRNWIRTAALRTAQNLGASNARRPLADEQTLAQIVEPGEDPALGLLRQQYGEQFRLAFEAAVGDLTARERTLLRLAFVDGATSDALSAVYGVHRATAARWVASARDRLSARTRHRMMEQLGIGRADLQSIMRLIQSQLDVSVRRCLGSNSSI